MKKRVVAGAVIVLGIGFLLVKIAHIVPSHHPTPDRLVVTQVYTFPSGVKVTTSHLTIGDRALVRQVYGDMMALPSLPKRAPISCLIGWGHSVHLAFYQGDHLIVKASNGSCSGWIIFVGGQAKWLHNKMGQEFWRRLCYAVGLTNPHCNIRNYAVKPSRSPASTSRKPITSG